MSLAPVAAFENLEGFVFAYARHRGVSASTVQKAIRSGRTRTMPNGQIDSEIAVAEWARNTQTQVPPVDRRGQPEEDGEVFGA